MKNPRDRSGLAALAPAAWLALFFLLPFLLVFKLSLSDVALAQPPYAPRLDLAQGLDGLRRFFGALDGETYRRLTSDRIYVVSYLSSLAYAGTATALLLLIGYPVAYGITRCTPPVRRALLMAVAAPFWTSFLIRVYAWIAILRPAGLLNGALNALGLPPVELLYTDAAVILGLVYAYLPFMILPLYAVLERQEPQLLEAAADLGAGPATRFWRVTFPLSLPGVAAGVMLCFIPMVGEFVVPDLLGGSNVLMLGRTIWIEFFANRDWPTASAAAVVLLVTLVGPILLVQRRRAQIAGGR